MGQVHDLWRQMAIEDRLQFYASNDPFNASFSRPIIELSRKREPASEWADCAVTSVLHAKLEIGRLEQLEWVCPECYIERKGWVHHWMMHMNNVHKWDWLQFANKFPEFG